MQTVITKDGYKLEFPVINIGQFDKQTINNLNTKVKEGKLIKYEDYTFPRTKTGYAVRVMDNIKAQSILESLKSLFAGAWNYVPDAMVKVEHQLLSELDQLKEVK